MIFREETLQNVISAVTGNLRSIIFTFILALILVYFFSIFGFIFFQGKTCLFPSCILIIVSDDFLIETHPLTSSRASSPSESCAASADVVEDLEAEKERSCDTLFMCLVTTMNQVYRGFLVVFRLLNISYSFFAW